VHRLIKTTALVGVLVFVPAPSIAAAATPWESITIAATRVGPIGSFTSSGAFADAGSFMVARPTFGGPGPGRFVIVHATETFAGASGTFTVARNVRVTWGDDPTVRTIEGNWVVISGTGAYADLHGHGTISGTVQGFPPAEQFVLTYRGTVGPN
jgi:hypothetical protein